jgi:hypothetical protein
MVDVVTAQVKEYVKREVQLVRRIPVMWRYIRQWLKNTITYYDEKQLWFILCNTYVQNIIYVYRLSEEYMASTPCWCKNLIQTCLHFLFLFFYSVSCKDNFGYFVYYIIIIIIIIIIIMHEKPPKPLSIQYTYNYITTRRQPTGSTRLVDCSASKSLEQNHYGSWALRLLIIIRHKTYKYVEGYWLVVSYINGR